jgi:hypothetical protein
MPELAGEGTYPAKRRVPAKEVAAAFDAVATPEGRRALTAALAKLAKLANPSPPATRAELAALANHVGKVPPDLRTVYEWANGNRDAEHRLLSIAELAGTGLDACDDAIPLFEVGTDGAYLVYVTSGPLRGALRDHASGEIRHFGLLAWAKHRATLR